MLICSCDIRRKSAHTPRQKCEFFFQKPTALFRQIIKGIIFWKKGSFWINSYFWPVVSISPTKLSFAKITNIFFFGGGSFIVFVLLFWWWWNIFFMWTFQVDLDSNEQKIAEISAISSRLTEISKVHLHYNSAFRICCVFVLCFVFCMIIHVYLYL